MRPCLVAGIAMVLAAVTAHAQYYEPRGYQPADARYLAAGFLLSDFQPRSSNPLADSGAIAYSRVMPTLAFRQGPVEAMFGYARYTLQGERREAIIFSALFTNDIPLTGERDGGLLGSLMLATDFTKAEAAGPQRGSFNIVSIGIGGGVKYRSYDRSADFSVSAGGIAHFSFEGLSTGSGFSGAIVSSVSLILPQVPIFEGLALGYRFRHQMWSMSEKRFNYRGVFHGPQVGILF